MHITPHPILSEIEDICRQHGFGLSEFGLLATNDGSLVSNLREGRDPRRATVAKINLMIQQIKAGAVSPKSASAR